MKRLLNILLLTCLAPLAMAQQKPVYERTRAGQVISDAALQAKYLLVIPAYDIPTVPSYMPDSLKSKVLVKTTGNNPSFPQGIYFWDTDSVQWIRLVTNTDLADYVSIADSANFVKHAAGGLTKVGTTAKLGGVFDTGTTLDNTSGGALNINSSSFDYLGSGNYSSGRLLINGGVSALNQVSVYSIDQYGSGVLAGAFKAGMYVYPAFADKTMSFELNNDPSISLHPGAILRDDYSKKGHVGYEDYSVNAWGDDLAYTQVKLLKDHFPQKDSVIKNQSVSKQTATFKINGPATVGSSLVGDTTRMIQLAIKGTSITLAIGWGGVTEADSGYVYKLSRLAGVKQLNLGLASRLLQATSPIDSSFYSTRYSVPNYVPGNYLGFDCFVNDSKADSTVYNTTTFSVQLDSVITAAQSRGWPASHIIILNTNYYNPTSAATYPNTDYRHSIYSAAAHAVASSKGCLFYDGYNDFKTAWLADPAVLYTDILHPTNKGHTVVANLLNTFLSAYISPVVITKELAKVQGSQHVYGDISVDQNIIVNNDITVGNNITSKRNVNTITLNATTENISGISTVSGTSQPKQLRIGTPSATTPYLFNYALNSATPDPTGTNLTFFNYTGAGGATGGAFTFRGVNFTQTSGAQFFGYVAHTFAPTSGTATDVALRFDHIINQTGGANGITRTIYINPTLTAAADYRALEFSQTSGTAIYQAGSGVKNYFNGSIGIGVSSPTARLHLAAGTATANTQPLKLTAGVNATTPEAGAIEFDGTDLRYTTSTPTRRTVVNTDAAQTLISKTLTTPKWTGYTVSTLPAGTVGMVAYVTDATAPTYLGTLTGGGSVVTPVFYNGSAWVAH